MGATRDLSRLELVGETMRRVLNNLAIVAPDWLLAHSSAEWVERYGARVQDYRLPKGQAQRETYADVMGADGLTLLNALWEPGTPSWMREIPAVRTLHRVWLQSYTWRDESTLRWRQLDELPPSSLAIRTPYDDEVRFERKRATDWIGYKVHLTETCDPDAPRVITHVETSPAPMADERATRPIHADLQVKDLLPKDHLVDTAYLDAELLVESQCDYQVNLVGPTRRDTGWQAREPGNLFTVRDFQIDWEHQHAICPAGQQSQTWMPAINNRGLPVIQIKFARNVCRVCPVQSQCTHSNPPRRAITIQPEAPHKALFAARERETTSAFAEQYARRAGIEGTISLGVRVFDLRRSRYFGQVKTHLQHLLIAMAINLVRIRRWLADDPIAQGRTSAFERLRSEAAPLAA